MSLDSLSTVTSEELQVAEQYRRRRETAVLCVVFGDIKDSTRLLEELGEVDYDELRRWHDQVVRTVIEKDDAGTVLKTAGDGFLAIFSEPSSAVERCLELQRSLSGHRWFRLRIGVDMGQVALKLAAGIVADIFGRQVNRASRIESLATPGTVLASFPVYDCAVGWLRNTVGWSHRAPTQLRGFAEAITLHEPALLAGGRGVSATFIGSSSALSSETLTYVAEDPYRTALDRIRRALVPSRFGFGRQVCSRILWVDDHPENNLLLAHHLAEVGAEIRNVLDTSSAISAVQSTQFAAVISDMGRGTDSKAGLGLLSGLRQIAATSPCLVFTSPTQVTESAAAAEELGAAICTSGCASLLRCLADILERARRTMTDTHPREDVE